MIISQLADDTTMFLKNREQIPPALEVIEQFSQASGLRLNLSKCELMSIHNCPDSSIYDIPVKAVKYFGIWISKKADTIIEKNIQNNVDKCSEILNHWLQRDLTLFGRTMLTKIESLSRFIYPAYSLAISQRQIKEINRIHFNFIWKNKHHYIKKGDLWKDYGDGGLKAIDFEIMNGVLKVKWLQSFLKNGNDIWFSLPSFIFNKVGGIQFLLTCDFEITKLPIKISAFHQQVLLQWKMIFKHNFIPHTILLWNNRVILSRRKSIFMEAWFEKGIWSIVHLMDDQGNILELKEFNNRYNIECSIEVYKKVPHNIPGAFIQIVKNSLRTAGTLRLPKIKIDDVDLMNKKCHNK